MPTFFLLMMSTRQNYRSFLYNAHFLFLNNVHFFRTHLDQNGENSKSAQKRIQIKAGFSKNSYFGIRQANSYFQSSPQKKYRWRKFTNPAQQKSGRFLETIALRTLFGEKSGHYKGQKVVII